MDILAIDKLALFIVFVIPGFLMLKVWGLLSAAGHRDSSQQLIDAVAYSCINYAVLAFPVLSLESSNWRTTSPNWYFGIWAVFVLLVPITLTFCLWKLRSTDRFQRVLPHPVGKAWDFFFAQRKPLWSVVTLKDGRKVGGLFSTKSFASSHPYPQEIYIQDAWVVNADGGLERERESTAGIFVAGSEISTIEFFKPDWSDADERSSRARQGEQEPIGAKGISTVDADESPQS